MKTGITAQRNAERRRRLALDILWPILYAGVCGAVVVIWCCAAVFYVVSGDWATQRRIDAQS